MKSILSILAITAVFGMVVYSLPKAHAAVMPTPVMHRAYDPQFATEDVSFNLKRVQNDPGGAIGWRQLASAYLAAAREKDSPLLARKSQEAASKSLSIRTRRNASAAVILAEGQLEEHRFNDAMTSCQQSLAIEPNNDFAERTMTDIYFEIGRYDDARKMIGKHPEWSEDPGGLSILARQQELIGRSDEATVSLQKAVKLVESQSDTPATSVSWFHVKYGDLLARNGQLPSAESEYQTALNMNPGSWKALASMARLKALQSDSMGVIRFGTKLNDIAPMTDVVGLMEDASVALDDKPKAAKYSAQVLAMNKSAIEAGTKTASSVDQTRVHTHDRMFSLYLADHNMMLPLAQHAATHEIANRRDIYAFDTYAWATYKLAMSPVKPASSVALDAHGNAGLIEAKQYMDRALVLGTKDAKLLYHAGMIEKALNHQEVANKFLAESKAINPYWKPASVRRSPQH